MTTSPTRPLDVRDPMERWKEDYPGTTLGELHKLDPALVEAVLAWSAEIATSDDEDES